MAKRTIESYNRHLNVTVKNCSKEWIVMRDNTQFFPSFILIPRSCGSNFCPKCRADNLRRLRKALFVSMNKDRWRLVTLTFPQKDITPEEILSNCYSMFRKFTMRLKRKAPHLKYVRALEIHKNGYPHLHCVFNQYVAHGFLKKAWQDLGGGIVDIRATKKCEKCGASGKCEHHPNKTRMNYKQAARYLTEEMEKKAQDPHVLGYPLWRDRIRTITTSRNFKIKPVTGAYTFCGLHPDLKSAMAIYEELQFDADMMNAPPPSKIKTGSAIIINANAAQRKYIPTIIPDFTPPPKRQRVKGKAKFELPLAVAAQLKIEVGF